MSSRFDRAAVFILVGALVAFSGCFGMKTEPFVGDAGAYSDADSDTDADTDSDADADTDSDTDGDSDSDSDSDSDADSDSDTDVDCGEVDMDCCEMEPLCEDGALAVNIGPDTSDCLCCLECTPAACEDELDVWDAEYVPCTDVSMGAGIGACITNEDLEPIDYDCEDPDEACVTPTGYEDGVCVSDGTYFYCLRRCTPDNDVCDVVHTCTALIGGSGDYLGGACVPND